MPIPSVWVERYRPRSVNDVIYKDEKQEKLFQSFVSNKSIPNLLLSGAPGTGKSSTSKALVKDLNIDPADVLTVKCSKDKIEAIRNRVEDFSMTMPIGDFKIVRLEEIDGIGPTAMWLLRTTIEDSSATCRYIATCNYANKIIPPLMDRFQHFIFTKPNREKIAEKMYHILEAEKVQFSIDDLITYINVGYPSVRNIIQRLQQNTFNNVLLSPSNEAASNTDWKFGLLEALNTGNFRGARKLVCDASPEEHEEVFRFLYTNVDKIKITDKEAAIVTIADYMYKHSLVSDTEINLAALMIQLGKL